MIVSVASPLMCLSNEGNAVCFCIWVCQPEERLFQKSRSADWMSIQLLCLLWDKQVSGLLAADLAKDMRLPLQTSEESWAGCCLENRLRKRRQLMGTGLYITVVFHLPDK